MSLIVKLDETVDAEGAQAVLSGLTAPAPMSDIIEWLTICAVKTVHAKGDDMSSDLKMKVFASDLMDYPGDVVRHVLKEWPTSNKWFPSWSELVAQIDAMSGNRPAIVQRVGGALRRPRSVGGSAA